jgi:transposase
MVLSGQSNVHAQTFSIGPSLVFERIWEELGLPGILKALLTKRKFGFDVERAVFVTVLHRLMMSGSDRQCHRWIQGQRITGAEELSLQHLYRAMGFLGEVLEDQQGRTPFIERCTKDIIEEKMFERRMDLFSNLSMVFFDTTSIYFEGEGGACLGNLGHSKDNRPDLHQMVVGAVLNDQGEPVCCEVWPGNTADISSLIPVVDRMKTRFGITDFCVVADRGMISGSTITELEKRGISYILGVRMRKQKLVSEQVLSRGGRYKEVRSEKGPAEKEPLKVKEVWADDKRFIVCFNERQARKDEATRNAIIDSLRDKLHGGQKSLIGNKGYQKYLMLKKDALAIDQTRIEADKQYDGKWVLTTNRSDWSQEFVALQYKELWQVEKVFRDLKSVLDTRPIYHKFDDNIIGHVFCSFLALVMKKELDKRLESSELNFEWMDIKRDLLALQEVVLQEDKNRTVAIRTAPQGCCSYVLNAVGVALPKTIREISS